MNTLLVHDFFNQLDVRDLTPLGRLDWVLGLDDDAPEERFALAFTPTLPCLDRGLTASGTATNGVRFTSARPLGSNSVVRTCKRSILGWLSLGSYYNYEARLQHPARAGEHLKPFFPQPQYHKRIVNLHPTTGSLYLIGGANDLPERLKVAARMHAPLANGVSFYVTDTTDNAERLTLLIPCSVLVGFRDFTFGHIFAKGYGQPRRAPTGTLSAQRNQTARPPEQRDVEAARITARALVFGHPGSPRPLLVRLTNIGPSLVSGYGFSHRDELGEVLCIIAGLTIERPSVVAFRRRLLEYRSDRSFCDATFAPVFLSGDVSLIELNTSTRHGFHNTIENYDIHSFRLQRSYLRDVFSDPLAIHDVSILRDEERWRFTRHAIGSVQHHSVALSASFVKCREDDDTTRPNRSHSGDPPEPRGKPI